MIFILLSYPAVNNPLPRTQEEINIFIEKMISMEMYMINPWKDGTHLFFALRSDQFSQQTKIGWSIARKKWQTQNPYFKLSMTRIGMVVVDDFFFYLHVLKPKLQQRMGLQFSKILASHWSRMIIWMIWI